ncbi:MAG: methyltransferase domain-containing protein, partial [Pseudomonadota bacterium]
LIHSSGVLHHTENPMKILKEFRRIIKPDGTIQIMVYNYESIWVHLYVAYELMLNDGSLKNRALRRLGIKKYPKNLADAFRSSTDGTHCPISRFYKPSEFLLLLKQTQFSGQYKGASVSLWMEMNRLSKRFAAIADRRLPKESREFLYRLNFDKRGVPLYDGFSAGIGGCYEARPE